jgi:flagellar basal-body rod protein FlgC
MGFENMFGATNVSASGMSAERLRMEVVANNIANANSTRTAQGGPYRRQDVVFATMLNERMHGNKSAGQLAGVQVVDVVDDMTELPLVYNPGHPDADARGFVAMPNVQLATEMVNLMMANRAYEANLKVMQAFRQQADQVLTIGRS